MPTTRSTIASVVRKSVRGVDEALGVQPLTVRRACRLWCELLAAWGIAVVQPLLNLLGDATDYFLSFRFTPGDVRLFVAVLALLAPTVVWLVEIMLRQAPTARAWVHYVFIGVCATMTLAQVAKLVLNQHGATYLVVIIVASSLVLGAYLSLAPIRDWLAWAAIVPLLATVLFFFSTPSGRYARAVAQAESATASADSVMPYPIVVLMLDEFPLGSLLDGAGNIDESRYPNFARLVASSTWYRNYSTTSELTPYAVPSMLSGINPKRGLSPTYLDHPNTLLTLAAATHEVHASEILTQLCSPQICESPPPDTTTSGATNNSGATSQQKWRGFFRGLKSVMSQRLDTTLKNEVDAFVGQTAIQNADAGTSPNTADAPTTSKPSNLQLLPTVQERRFTSWVKNLAVGGDTAKPPMYFLHVLLPHQPWAFLPDGSTYQSHGPEWTTDETSWQVKVRELRHLLQVQHVDTLIGQFLDQLQTSGLFDKSLVIVAADHGVSFVKGYHRRFAGGDLANATQLMHVPLFVHYPNQSAGSIDDSNVENIDVLPMVADHLNFTIPWTVDGIAPAKKSASRASSKTFFFMTRPLGGPARSGRSMTVPMSQFTQESMTWGFSQDADTIRRDDPLSHLYAASPFDALRGSSVSGFNVRDGSLTFTFTDPRSAKESPVLVDGTVHGGVRAKDWFAFAIDGRILGLSPSSATGEETPVTALMLTSEKTPARLTVYRVIDAQTLEQVTTEKK